MKSVNIRFSNKLTYLLLSVLSLLIISGVVYAYGSSSPSVMGHSLGELGIPSCSDGQVVKYSSGSLVCGSDNAGSTASGIEQTSFDIEPNSCSEQNLETLCSDNDGCIMRILVYHQGENVDQESFYEERIYFEQASMSNNIFAGKTGVTLETGEVYTQFQPHPSGSSASPAVVERAAQVKGYSWLAGAGNYYYTIFNTGKVAMYNYRNGVCGGGAPYSNPYQFALVTQTNTKAHIIIYDY